MDMSPIGFIVWLGCASLAAGLFSAGTQTSNPKPQPLCHDLDTHGCQVFQRADSEMCEKAEFEAPCKRYCGKCPLECYSCPEAMTNPTDCNVTMLCDDKSVCMKKSAKTAEGVMKHMFTCERKEICQGLTIGFGKRGSNGDRAERNVVLNCCETDFCNSPFVTTTTTSATTSARETEATAPMVTETTTAKVTTPVHTKPPATTAVKPTSSMQGCVKDIVFVLDDSYSIGKQNFGHEVDFIRRIVSNINVGRDHAHVAVMVYSNHPHVQWYLDRYTSRPDVLDAINHLHYQGGWTHISEALQAVKNQILVPSRGDRPHAENVVVVLTDGRDNQVTWKAMNVIHATQALHTVSRDVISVVVGNGIERNVLNNIATDRHHVVDIRDYDHLHGIVGQVARLVCM